MASKHAAIENLNRDQSLFLLRVFYGKLFSILNALNVAGIMTRDDELNNYYTLLKAYTENILARKDLEKLASKSPELYESLIRDPENIERMWPLAKTCMLDFQGAVEKEYIFAGRPQFELDARWKDFLQEADEVLSAYKKRAEELDKRYTDSWIAQGKRIAKQFHIRAIRIKTIGLDSELQQLKINGGEIVESFNSKRGKTGMDAENKAFKVLAALWDFRDEKRNGKSKHREGGEPDFMTLNNLTRASGCMSGNATRQHIKRLNARFAKRDLPIKIELHKEKVKLVVEVA